jgi:hypothetical protein
MLQRGEYGIPPNPPRVLLEGSWYDGKSLGKLNQRALAEPLSARKRAPSFT